MGETRIPRVFLSYSHDSPEHQQRVLGLADRLRADGVEAEIDQYNPAPAEGWPLWCERQIETADFVLMVCTESYHRRVRGDEAPGQGLGVVWEARIIRQLLYDAGTVSAKFIPVLLSHGAAAHIPTPVKGASWYVIDQDPGYESLYRRLTDQPEIVRPAVGKLRPLPPRQRKWLEAIAGETAPAPATRDSVPASGDRGVAIGGNVTGSAIVTGDGNVTDVHYRKVGLSPAESVDIRAELAALRELLGGLSTNDRQKIANALSEADSDAAKPQPDKDEIGGALERALRCAGKAAGFAEKVGEIAPHVGNAVAWLGEHWRKLLPLVGLAP
jgi:hypothetical protein